VHNTALAEILLKLIVFVHQMHLKGWILTSLAPDSILIDPVHKDLFIINLANAVKIGDPMQPRETNIMFSHPDILIFNALNT